MRLKEKRRGEEGSGPKSVAAAWDVIEKAQECANKSMQVAQATTDVTADVAGAKMQQQQVQRT